MMDLNRDTTESHYHRRPPMPDHEHDQAAREVERITSDPEAARAILRRLELVWGTVAAEPEGELGKGAWEFEDLLRAAVPVAITLATEALELREENAQLTGELQTLENDHRALAEQCDEAEDQLKNAREENARLARELEQAREDAEVGRLLREMPSNWMFYWRGGRWHINIKVSTGLVPFNGYDTESLVNEARKILDKDSCWSEIVETRDANPGGEEKK